MSFWVEWMSRLRALLGLHPPDVPVDGGGPPQSVRARVLLITYHPSIHSQRGRRLAELLGWHDVDELTQQYIADLRECSGGFVDYQIIQRIEVDAWPVKADRFRYDEASFLQCWQNRTGWHTPDLVNYEAILADFDLLTRVDTGQIDEVWLFGFPYAGFYESVMVGPDAFWCNAPPLRRTDGISRRFVIMGFNYERGVGPMLESFGHRTESHLKYAWRHWHGQDNLWEKFILYDMKAPGQANCGWMHYAPNSLTDYDWGNRTKVWSNCDDWYSFPNLRGIKREVNCSEWGNGDDRAHHKWWFNHLPKAPGQIRGIANNWWWYAVDPNAVR